MASYKESVGTAVVNYAGNYPGAVEGELWYDSTNKDFKYQYPNVTTTGSWSTGGSLNTARRQVKAAGIYTAALAIGGYVTSPQSLTESYNGSNWTEVNDLNSGRGFIGGSGTQTAALGYGGPGTTVDTELWNGSNWTEVNNLNTARNGLQCSGNNTNSMLAVGGNVPGSPGKTAKTEEWNGSSWSEQNDLATARSNSAASGSTTAGLYFAGQTPTKTGVTEEWNIPSSTVKTLTD